MTFFIVAFWYFIDFVVFKFFIGAMLQYSMLTMDRKPGGTSNLLKYKSSLTASLIVKMIE